MAWIDVENNIEWFDQTLSPWGRVSGSLLDPLSPAEINDITSYLEYVYNNSSIAAAILDNFAAPGTPLRIGKPQDGSAAIQQDDAVNGDYIGYNLVEIDKLWAFNDTGSLVKSDVGLSLMHEIIHYDPATSGPDLPGITDTILNGANINQQGPILAVQNQIANQLNAEVQQSYLAALSTADSRYSILDTSSYTGGATIDNIRLGLLSNDNIDHTARTDNSRDLALGLGGQDVISTGGGDDFLYGGLEDDLLDGGDGNDMLYGEGDDDTLIGSAGADTLTGGGGSDHYFGGSGDDIIYVGLGSDVEADGGSDFDTLSFRDAASGVSLLINANTSSLGSMAVAGFEAYSGTAFADTMQTTGPGDVNFSGAAGDDTLTGGTGNDVLEGGDDDDTLTGGGGADALYGGAGADTLHLVSNESAMGGAGDDVYKLAMGTGTGTNGAAWIFDVEGNNAIYFENSLIDELFFDANMIVGEVVTDEGTFYQYSIFAESNTGDTAYVVANWSNDQWYMEVHLISDDTMDEFYDSNSAHWQDFSYIYDNRDASFGLVADWADMGISATGQPYDFAYGSMALDSLNPYV